MSDADYKDVFECTRMDAMNLICRSIDPLCVGTRDLPGMFRWFLKKQYKRGCSQMVSYPHPFLDRGGPPTQVEVFARFVTWEGGVSTDLYILLEFLGASYACNVLRCINHAFARGENRPRRGGAEEWLRQISSVILDMYGAEWSRLGSEPVQRCASFSFDGWRVPVGYNGPEFGRRGVC
jgi:hypothetical protein